jgi:hypothetical protein
MEAALQTRKATVTTTQQPAARRNTSPTRAPTTIEQAQAEGHYTALPESAFDGIQAQPPPPDSFGEYGAIAALQDALNAVPEVPLVDGPYSMPPPPAETEDIVNQRPPAGEYQHAGNFAAATATTGFRQQLTRVPSRDNKRPTSSAYGSTPKDYQPTPGTPAPTPTATRSPIVSRLPAAPNVARTPSPTVTQHSPVPPARGAAPEKAPMPARMTAMNSRVSAIQPLPPARGGLGGVPTRGAPPAAAARPAAAPATEGLYSELELIAEPESHYDDVEELDDPMMANCSAPQLAKHSWYFGNLPRERAEQLLKSHPLKTFLVRDSSQANAFVITVVSSTNVVKNILAQGQPQGGFKLGSDPFLYTTLEQLIESYRKQAVPTLVKPLSRFEH